MISRLSLLILAFPSYALAQVQGHAIAQEQVQVAADEAISGLVMLCVAIGAVIYFLRRRTE